MFSSVIFKRKSNLMHFKLSVAKIIILFIYSLVASLYKLFTVLADIFYRLFFENVPGDLTGNSFILLAKIRHLWHH